MVMFQRRPQKSAREVLYMQPKAREISRRKRRLGHTGFRDYLQPKDVGRKRLA